jgi:hypothetical protein
VDAGSGAVYQGIRGGKLESREKIEFCPKWPGSKGYAKPCIKEKILREAISIRERGATE